MTHKYSIHCFWSDEDNAFIACTPELPGCMADGPTVKKAIDALSIVIDEWIETAKEIGRGVPAPLTSDDIEKLKTQYQLEQAARIRQGVQAAVTNMLEDGTLLRHAINHILGDPQLLQHAVNHILRETTLSKYIDEMTRANKIDPADYWKREHNCLT